MSHRHSLAGLVLGVAVALAVTACSHTSGIGSKTGGQAEPVTLTLADGYSDPDFEPAVGYFMQRLEQLSGGQVRVKDKQGWGHLKPGFEQQIVSDVAAGKADLGWTGTRVFDTLGVTSFQALTAPMLIDGYSLEDAIIGSPIPGEMLKGLHTVRVTGLAVLGDGLRKPIAKDKPLVSPADWKGVAFNVLRSKAAAAAVAATGAIPTDDIGGTPPYVAAERNLRIYRDNYVNDYRYVTANVNLWPQTLALFANPARLARLTDQQQGWVQSAAKDAAARSTAFFDHDQDLVTTSCAKGARIANASAADLRSLRSLFDGVYADLNRDATTRSYIDRIEAIKRGLPTPPALDIPADCNAAHSRPPVVDPLQGVWISRDLTEADIVHAFVAAGGTEAAGHAWFLELGRGSAKSVTFQLRFAHGSLDEFDRADGGTFEQGDSRTYLVEGHGITFSSTGCEARYRMHLQGDTLRLRAVAECPGHDKPYGVSIYGSFPFKRAS